MRSRAIFASFAQPPWPLLFMASATGYLLIAFSDDHALAIAGHAGAHGSGPSFAAALSDWLVMLLAMMPLAVGGALAHVSGSSLSRRRLRSSSLFVLAYAAVWALAGIPVVWASAAFLRSPSLGAFVLAVAVACLWSASPLQQMALNRGHRLASLRPFGLAADRDCLVFGARHGLWCIASCWPWMLVPLAAPAAHLEVMMAAGAVMIVQRLARPRRPRWRLPFSLSGVLLPDRRRAAAAA